MIRGKDLKAEWDVFVQSGSEQAFYKIYTQYFHYLHYIGLKKGISVAKTKDSINDLFLYLWENREKQQLTTHPHNYIVTSFLRRLFRKESFSADESEILNDLSAPGFEPSAEVQHILFNYDADLSKLIEAHLQQLPHRQRSMIYQKFFLGLSYKEIAQVNKVSINTVYNTIYKALNKLKSLIENEQSGLFPLSFAFLLLLFFIFFQKH